MHDNFNDAIHSIANEIAELVVSKQKDYGTGNILNSPAGPENGIIVRLFDKAARIDNLTDKAILKLQNDMAKNVKEFLHKLAKNEPLEDSWKDVAGYSLIALMVQRGVFELPLKEDKE